MNNKELITKLAERIEWSTHDVTEMMSAVTAVISSRLVDNDVIGIQGFGQFEVRKKAERISVNPANGKRYLVPPKLVAVFKPGPTLKKQLKSLEEDE